MEVNETEKWQFLNEMQEKNEQDITANPADSHNTQTQWLHWWKFEIPPCLPIKNRFLKISHHSIEIRVYIEFSSHTSATL